MKKFFIPTPLGKIAAVAHQSKQADNKLAVIGPGFLDSKDYPHLVALANDLSERGYTAVRFDPLGTWDSEGDISVYTNTQYIKDFEVVIDFMLAQNNYEDILVVGHSRAGSISLFVAAQDSRVTKVISIMGAPINQREGESLAKWQNQGFRLIDRDIPNSTERKQFNVPFSHVDDQAKYNNNFNLLKQIKSPKLIIAGEIDTVRPLDHMKQLYTELTELKRFVLAPKIGHDYRFNPDEIKVVNRLILDNLDF